MKTWFNIKAAASGEKHTEVMIFDEIGLWGVTAKDFATSLKEIPDDHEITVRINSPGGSVFDGYAIYNALKSRAAQVTTRVEGLAASMASIVALGGSKVTAAANSMFMIHNPWSCAAGDGEELRKAAELLDKLAGQLVGIYAGKCGKSEDEVRKAMDDETWFTAAEAKAWGLVDEITDEIPAVASFDVSRFRNAPKALAHRPSEIDAIRAELATSKQQAADADVQIVALRAEASQAQTALASAIAERDALKAEAANREANDFVSAAISAGKLTEDARAQFVDLFKADPVGTRKLVDALRPALGAAPVKAEAKTESGQDAEILAEYRSLNGDAKTKFYAKNKDAIWRAASAQ